MDLVQFFGRFHVLVLHLPIGILMLAAVLEVYWVVKKQSRNALANWIWFWGAVSAISACALGYMLSLGEGYNPDAVDTHMIYGLSTAGMAIFAGLALFCVKSPNKALLSGISVVQLALLFATGHYGANMTHGETYLVEHAPNFVRTLTGFPPHAVPRPEVTTLAQADVYLDLVEPMLKQRCTSCHNDAKQKGRLNLASIESLFKGGKSGAAISPGDVAKSELITRITLNHDHKEFMPAEGKTPLTDEQVASLIWWVKADAPTEGMLADLAIDKEDKTNLASALGLGQSDFPLPDIEPARSEQLTALSQAGFVIKALSQQNNYLDVDYSTQTKPLNQVALAALASVKDHVAVLNLRNAQVSDEQLLHIAQLPNLVKLRLEQNALSSAGVAHLVTLPHLEYLNLYNTNIDNTSLKTFAAMPALKHVFVGQTQVTVDAISAFSSSNVNVQGAIASTPSDANATNTNNKES